MEALQIPDELVNGGDCFSHFHSSDRAPTHDTLARLQQLNNQVTPTGSSYNARYTDDLILVDNGASILLPPTRNGKEFEVVMTGIDNVTVNFTSPDLLYGSSSALLTVQGMSLRFKSIPTGFILI